MTGGRLRDAAHGVPGTEPEHAPLTWLYAPGDRADVVGKALTSGADVVIVDLEDAVAPERKAYALRATAELLSEPRPGPVPVHVRVNALEGPLAAEEVRTLAALPGLGGLRLPKVDGADDVVRVAQWAQAAEAQSAQAQAAPAAQAHAAARIYRYGELGHPSRPVFDLLLRFAISEDGALHGEKFYRTVTEEFNTTRPAFRWRHLIALARVTASEYGRPAPGIAEARALLKA